MPKVVSRSAVSSSTDARPTASSAAALRVYYCICGEFILVIDKTIASLPRRQTDGAIIVRAQDSDAGKARVFKLNAVAGDPVLLERQGGHERQFRFHCPRCTLPIGYQSTPPPAKSGPFVYIFAGALSQVQGEVPSDAFDGENGGDLEAEGKVNNKLNWENNVNATCNNIRIAEKPGGDSKLVTVKWKGKA